MEDKEFFNSLAEEWDNICEHPKYKVDYVMSKIDLENGDKVIDVGSGTGVLIPYIEEKIGSEGYVTAIDLAENMIKVSKRKNKFCNLEFIIDDFLNYNSKEKVDYIIAYSCYPHFKDKNKFFEKANSLLEVGGKIVIAHIENKELINSRHKEVDDKIKSDILPNVKKTAQLVERHGFNAIYTEDSDEYYICIGEKI
ncbi:class I SAM-dependent methyltransferase [Clostridium niameyense]|uniref:Class I SAM-dependent methyltransferase n=1 Tax=Clostridium niameyense TaxID=1622073 RepID=A0A6M0RCG1_9CLOT|nr:methyltransferase domain-containing protein [Clostridium niameyense]NEZ47487.1 class I SAM-dependent methyltransferase [Clostridium niameyense]